MRPLTEHDLRLQAAVRDDFIAQRYGWTIEQIDLAPVDRLDAMVEVAEIKIDIENEVLSGK